MGRKVAFYHKNVTMKKVLVGWEKYCMFPCVSHGV